MENDLLIDSNVFIQLMRAGKDPAIILNEWAGRRNLATCGMVRLEVLKGMKVLKHREALARFMDVMVHISSDNRLWAHALEMAWNQERIGHPIPNADAVIAACALRISATVVTSDAHFSRIEGLKVIAPPKEWFE